MKYFLSLFIAVVMLGVSLFPTNSDARRSYEHIFYYYENESGYQSVEENYRDIDILAPQIYQVDFNGNLIGPEDERILELAEDKNLDVMPLVVNAGFSRTLMMELLVDEDMQDELIDQLIDEARDRDYIGWQFDFENINPYDRDAYTDFVERAYRQFRRKRIDLSVAVIPRDRPHTENAWEQDWSSAYDVEALSEHSDFITLMSYDDPRSQGPVASMIYLENILEYLDEETDIRMSRLSLGIPFYCWQWDITENKRVASIPYNLAKSSVDRYQDASADFRRSYHEEYEAELFSFIKDDGHRNFVWCDNERSIEAKLDLMKEYRLHGTSNWALGQEDENVWEHY